MEMTMTYGRTLAKAARIAAQVSAQILVVALAFSPAESRQANHPTMRIAALGGTMRVRNFLADSDVIRVSPITRGGTEADDYYVLGSQPYENVASTTPKRPTLPAAETRGYQIDFFPTEGTFTIFIYREPVGPMRDLAAADASKRLGISTTKLCRIIAVVWISGLADSSRTYAGKNVGLPHCPGAYPL
jgi:hypothetical protein